MLGGHFQTCPGRNRKNDPNFGELFTQTGDERAGRGYLSDRESMNPDSLLLETSWFQQFLQAETKTPWDALAIFRFCQKSDKESRPGYQQDEQLEDVVKYYHGKLSPCKFTRFYHSATGMESPRRYSEKDHQPLSHARKGKIA
jgi:hypothetical protein